MSIAAKHFDPLVGIDIHIILIPTPAGPVPTPLPHPYIGMVLDPMDYVPILGATTYINGLPRGQAGSAGIAMPPHIPMGGPFAKPPTNESEIFMGSSVVVVDGEPQSHLGLPVLSCQDIGMPAPPRPKNKSLPKSLMLPTTVVLSIPMGMLVLIGGPPTISMMTMGMKAALGIFKKLAKLGPVARKIKALSDKIHALAEKAVKKAGLGDSARNAAHKSICSVTGHPVDVATGKVFTDAVDLELPGAIPFKWERTWFSTSTYAGPLGHGWHHSYDEALVFAEGVVLYRTGDGRHVGLPLLEPGAEHFDRKEKLTFSRDAYGYTLRNKAGFTSRFAPIGRANGEHALREVKNRVGQTLRLHYDAHGRLAQIVDTAGRILQILSDASGRITALTAPHPTTPDQQFYVARYAYDGWGNLASVTDSLGQPFSYAYQGRLLVRETNRNGLSFYFQYDRSDETARCTRTWGDGGIYDHKLSYDTDVTVVENSLGHSSVHQHREGLVIKLTDALGGVTQTEFGENNEVLSETDALGQRTEFKYDERGNLVERLRPDGSKLALAYDARDRLVAAVDAAGGKWSWSYDEYGRPAQRTNPLGETTTFEWSGSDLVAVTDAAKSTTLLRYDAAHNLVALVTEDGAESRWQHDALGRVHTSVDPNGNARRRQRDLSGRVVRVQEPDGNVRELTYDGQGNVARVEDRHRHIVFTYQGMSRLASRSEAGTTVQFQYDTEEELVAVVNEYGAAYRFVLDPAGRVVEEHGFDSLRRLYSVDKAGRVTEVLRANGRKAGYEYDPMGRIVAVEHDDGGKETYAYRSDGQLVRAVNDTVAVAFERDALGRITKEIQGSDWVESQYDARGRRSALSSSKGMFQSVQRDRRGEVLSIEAGSSPASGSGFSASFERDRVGFELSRSLPGGIRSAWQRDALGRPLRHEIFGAEVSHRARQYVWDADDRLQRVIDALSGPIDYVHDATGTLAVASHADGQVELRMPDAVGNLFRTQHRTDRSYGRAGQLLESRDRDGVTRYEYDDDGNLVVKTGPDGSRWSYHWNGAGMLARVVRPDGREVGFAYDALARRIAKTYRGKTTRWVWDGNVPLHEWVERDPSFVESEGAQAAARAESSLETRLKEQAALLVAQPAQGPPVGGSAAIELEEKYLGTPSAPITWLFEPESFAPLGKMVDGETFGIVTDHLGTPCAMFDARGREAWGADIDVYGKLRDVRGARAACPFRWPGQYEDEETGLYYNRFRYYDPEAGIYLRPDPLAIAGGLRLYGYPDDPTTRIDPLGLAHCTGSQSPPDTVTWYHGSLDADNVKKNGFSTKNKYGDDRGAPYVCVSTDRGAAANAVNPNARYDAQFSDPAKAGVVQGEMSRAEWDRLHKEGHLKTNDYHGFDHSLATSETKAVTPEGVDALNNSMIRS